MAAGPEEGTEVAAPGVPQTNDAAQQEVFKGAFDFNIMADKSKTFTLGTSSPGG